MDTILFIAAICLSPVIGGGFDELPTASLELLVFVTFVVWFTRHQKPPLPRVAMFIPLGALFLFVVVSAFFTENVYATVKSVLYLECCVLAFLLAVVLSRSRKFSSVVVWAVVIAATGISLRGIRDYAISTGGGVKFWQSLLYGVDHWRLFGTFANPSLFAGFLVVSILVSLGVYFSARQLVATVVAGIGVVAQFSALLLTGTKFAIVALSVGLMTWVVLVISGRLLKSRQLPRVLLIVVLLIPCVLIFSAPIRERVREAEAGGTQVHSTAFRIYVWRSTLKMIKDHPFVGLGPGTFEVAYPRYAIAGPTKHAHQTYLQLGAEAGLPTLLALMVVLGCITRSYIAAFTRGEECDGRNSSGLTEESRIFDLGNSFLDWRLVHSGIFSAFVGSLVRNLVDSDWLIVGILLPLAALVGIIVGQSAAAGESVCVKTYLRKIPLIMSVASVMLAFSIALGDLLVPDENIVARGADLDAMCRRYRLAVLANPINPAFRRDYARYLVSSSLGQREAERQLVTAIRLAPTDAANYFTYGLLALHTGEPVRAAQKFRMALKYNPNSTQTFYQLAQTYRRLGNLRAYESALKRLIQIEKSEYERVRGVPELVDLTYVSAHMYFGSKFMAEAKYAEAAVEYRAVVERIERWLSQKDIIRMQRVLGRLTRGEEQAIIRNLREAYLQLAKAYKLSGHPELARETMRKAGSLLRQGDFRSHGE
ncbi:MAG: O-antigen ligase family protein [Armatimonadota bacterium]